MEIWKDIAGYEGLYQVSNWGRVKSLWFSKEKILKGGRNNKGYLSVLLCKDGKIKRHLIHRLVAEAFIPNPLNLSEVNHKSEDKLDNRVENLEWCDHKYNNNYGTRNDRISEKLSKTVLQFSKTGEFIKEWESMIEIQRQLGYSQGNISNCCTGRCKSVYGYIWKYKKEVV